MNTPATLWFRVIEENGTTRDEFNHLEERFVPIVQIRPTPKSDATKLSWARGVWRCQSVGLTLGLPQKVVKLS